MTVQAYTVPRAMRAAGKLVLRSVAIGDERLSRGGIDFLASNTNFGRFERGGLRALHMIPDVLLLLAGPTIHLLENGWPSQSCELDIYSSSAPHVMRLRFILFLLCFRVTSNPRATGNSRGGQGRRLSTWHFSRRRVTGSDS